MFLRIEIFIFIQLIILKLSEEKVIYEELLPKKYNREIAPKVNGNAVTVNVSVAILSVLPETDTKMAFNVDLFLHLFWKDDRLQNIEGAPENIHLDYSWRNRIWVPDTYFRNAISGGVAQDVLSPSCYFIVKNRTDVFMAARLRMKISCNMRFHKYPFDSQLCFMNITTLSQTSDIVDLKWKTFQVGSRVQLPEYQIVNQTKGNCIKNYSFGKLPCLYVAIVFKRNVGNYLIKQFVPSFLIVTMSFMGFWIPTNIAPARVSLIITALLSLIAQQIQSELNVSYVYALQVWTIMCIVFVFATLLEYAIAISWALSEPSSLQNNISEGQRKNKFWFLRATPRNCIIDIMSRIVFPISFIISLIIFVIIYSNMDSK